MNAEFRLPFVRSFLFVLCACCSKRTPRMRCVFANATFTGGRATARSHENRSRGVVLSCRVRWHMRGGMQGAVSCARATAARTAKSFPALMARVSHHGTTGRKA